MLEAEPDGNGSTGSLSPAIAHRIESAFKKSDSAGLLHLATVELQSPLPPPLSFARDLARGYLTRLCQTPGLDGQPPEPIAPPPEEELGFTALRAPPMKGLEYLNASALERWWTALDEQVRGEIAVFPGGAGSLPAGEESALAAHRPGDLPSGREQAGRIPPVRVHGDLRS